MHSTDRRTVRLSKGRAPFILYQRTKRLNGKRVLLRPWHVRFTGCNSDGRRQQLRIALKTEDRQEAEQLAWEHYSDKAGPDSSSCRNPYVGPLLRHYRRHLKSNTAPRTARERWYVLRKFFRRALPNLKDTRLSEISTRMISQYIEGRRLKDGISAWSAKDVRKSLSALFSFARDQYGFRASPVSRVRCPRTDLAPIDYLARREIAPVLQAIEEEDPHILTPVATAIFAGLRRSEIAWLGASDADLQGRILWICRKIIRGERYETKTGKSRVVPISEDLLQFLRSHQPHDDWYFPSIRGRRWNANYLGQRLKLVMDRNKWPYTFQTFRHTFGSMLAQKGLSLYKISILMGNSEEVCRQHYAALCPAQMHEEVSFMRQLKSVAQDPDGVAPRDRPGTSL